MRGAYRALAGLIALGVLVQAAAVAGAWFGTINEIDDGATITEDYEGNLGHVVHGMNGMMIMPLLGLALFVVAFFAKTVANAVKFAGLTFLAIVVQIVLAFISFGVPAIGILHGVNAFVVFGLALMCVRRASAAPAVETTAATPGATASV
jgi:hypothetical protein